jgi:putative membrane protein
VTAAADGWHRLHPLSPAVRVVRALVPLVLVFLTSLASGDLWNDVGHAIAFAVALAAGAVSWLVTRWRVEDGALRIERGLLRRSSLRYPLAQLQAIDVVRPGVARLLGLAELRLRMGGSTGGDARLSYLPLADAETLRDELLELARGRTAAPATGEAEEQRRPAWLDEQVLVSIPTPRLVVSLLLGGPVALALLAIVGLVVAAVLAPSVAGGVLGGGVAPLLGVAVAGWRRFNNGYGLRLSESPDGLQLHSGLVETTTETIPRGRVQAVRMTEPLLWRPLGWARLEVDVAGRQRRRGENRSEGSQLRAVLPVGPRGEALALLGRLVEDAPQPADPAPRRAALKSPLRYRHLAIAVSDRTVATRSGRLGVRTSWVPLAKVQSLRWVQGPVQRRLRLGGVHVDVAGPSLAAVLRDRDVEESRRQLDRLAELARAARRG